MRHQTTIQLRHQFEIVSGSTPASGNADYWDGDIAWVTPEDVSQVQGNVLRDTRRKLTADGFANSGTTMARAGDIVLTKRAPIGQLALLGLDACSNQGCFLLSAREGVEPRYSYYVLANNLPLLQALGRGSTFMELSTDDLKALRVPVLEHDHQVAIADFLDRETARIDALVAAKQRLLNLLSEKRKAIIATAVTRGLDPTARMAPTGVEWIPQAPSHWRPSRIGRLFRQSKTLGFPDHTVLSVYREYGVIERSSRDDNSNVLPDDLAKYQLVEAGDLVVNKMKAWQGSLGVSDLRGITSPDYVVFRPTHSELPAYLHFMLRTPQLTTVYLSNSNGIRINQWRIEPERFLNVPVLLPPLDEQRAVVEHIARETAKLDAVRAATERTITLLKERRSALIAAAVTGQLDVAA